MKVKKAFTDAGCFESERVVMFHFSVQLFFDGRFLFFFACPKKNQKKTSENETARFRNGDFNSALVLLW
jgi:hypothetical protein